MSAETWKERKAKGLQKNGGWRVLPTRLLVEGTPLDPVLREQVEKAKAEKQ